MPRLVMGDSEAAETAITDPALPVAIPDSPDIDASQELKHEHD
jgi:hypothetical protein